MDLSLVLIAAVSAVAIPGIAIGARNAFRSFEKAKRLADAETRADTPPVSQLRTVLPHDHYRIIRRHNGFRYEWKTGDAEKAAATWHRYLANRDTHPGELEFFDGPHRRDHRSADA